MQLRADGVYAGLVPPPRRDPPPDGGLVGRQPTFFESRPYSLVEAHLLDFQGDLYDEMGTVELVAQLRGQVKFVSVEALIDQMTVDVAQTRRSPWPSAGRCLRARLSPPAGTCRPGRGCRGGLLGAFSC